jgi:hypothetical protein
MMVNRGGVRGRREAIVEAEPHPGAWMDGRIRPTDRMINEACAVACGWRWAREAFVRAKERRPDAPAYCTDADLSQERLDEISERRLFIQYVEALAAEVRRVGDPDWKKSPDLPRMDAIAALKTMGDWPKEWVL